MGKLLMKLHLLPKIAVDKKLRDMGEEVIKAQMDIEKIKIGAGIGLIFSLLIMFAVTGGQIQQTWVVLTLVPFFSIIVAAVIYYSWIGPSVEALSKCAVELDRRKKEQTEMTKEEE